VGQHLQEVDQLVIHPLQEPEQYLLDEMEEQEEQTDQQSAVTDETALPVIEALLFAADRPLSVSRLTELIGGVPQGAVHAAIQEICRDYNMNGRSIMLREVAGGFQFYTKPQYAPWLRKLYNVKSSNRLSPAALETLAIVAYKQPITRAEIEIIRGVNVTGLLNTLLERGLIKISGHEDTIGKPLLYRTTHEFLSHFGLADIRDLPPISSFSETA